jgi:hypothetical protein
VEHVREDVTILNAGWASSSWAWRWAMARDARLVVDLTPGLGGATRLSRVLRARGAGRAVQSEELSVLALATRGEVCPRGVGWSSPEGCAPGGAGSDAARAVLRREAARAARGSWDERLVLYTAGELANDALALGCPGLAARYLAAGLDAAVPAWAQARACDGRGVSPAGGPDVLTVSRGDLARALAHLAP